MVAAERADHHRRFSEPGECPVEMGRGFGPIGDAAARTGQSEREQGAVGGYCAGGHLVEPLDARLGGLQSLLGMSQCGGQGVLGGGVGAFEPGESSEFLLSHGRVEKERIAGGECFGFCRVQGRVADVPGGPVHATSGHDLIDEGSLTFQGLPHIGVEGVLRDDLGDGDLGVLVALPQDAAVTLCDVGPPPRCVEVHQVHGPGWDVGADAHLFGAPDKDGDVAVAAGSEHFRLVRIGGGIVDEPDAARRQSAGDQCVAQRMVDIPAVGGGGEVAEHDLQGAGDG